MKHNEITLPVYEERSREKDEGSDSIGVDNQDKVTGSTGHSCFADRC